MTNTIAIFIAVCVLGFVAVDIVYFEKANLLFLSKKFLELLSWVAFWR